MVGSIVLSVLLSLVHARCDRLMHGAKKLKLLRELGVSRQIDLARQASHQATICLLPPGFGIEYLPHGRP